MGYEDVVHRCFRCGYCKFTSDYQDVNCPAYRKFELDTYFAGGRFWLINAWLNEEIETSKDYGEILYSCATCANCEDQCPFGGFNDDLLDMIEDAKADLLDEGLVPSSVKDYLEAVSTQGNAYGMSKRERGKWAEGTGIDKYSDQEYLFYVGDVGSYDDVGKDMAESVGSLMTELGLSIGILGEEEISDGNDVKACGERGLFEDLVEKNIEMFDERGVEKIITLDPHAYNTFTQDYPFYGGEFEVNHFTQILLELLRENEDLLSEYNFTVTYHDPCYLGRHNDVYETPREILKTIPGLELVEMDKNRENAFCCGGGGGNVFTDVLESSGENSPSRVRVREALNTGADILAAACPACLTMLTDAVKAEGAEDEIAVKDLAEIVASAKSGNS